jgi:hypothetical protein
MPIDRDRVETHFDHCTLDESGHRSIVSEWKSESRCFNRDRAIHGTRVEVLNPQ